MLASRQVPECVLQHDDLLQEPHWVERVIDGLQASFGLGRQHVRRQQALQGCLRGSYFRCTLLPSRCLLSSFIEG